MDLIEYFTDKELKEEIARRKAKKEKDGIPKILNNKNFLKLVATCEEYIDELAKGDDGRTKDFNNYIFEAALTAVYGKEVWEWVSNQVG